MGKAPHFALFSSRGEVGSRHDITGILIKPLPSFIFE
jgi:hypothetical protein